MRFVCISHLIAHVICERSLFSFGIAIAQHNENRKPTFFSTFSIVWSTREGWTRMKVAASCHDESDLWKSSKVLYISVMSQICGDSEFYIHHKVHHKRTITIINMHHFNPGHPAFKSHRRPERHSSFFTEKNVFMITQFSLRVTYGPRV